MTNQIPASRSHARMFRLVWLAASLAVALSLVIGAASPIHAAALAPNRPHPTPTDWPMYLHDPQHTSASDEAILSRQNAPNLAAAWSTLTGGPLAASPTVVGGVVYVGSWDGYEYALDATLGTVKWKTFLGTSTNAACAPQVIGVTSAATVLNGIVYVGGGDAYWYALDAQTGSVLWQVYTGDNSAAGGHYNWSSPLIYNGYAYIGIASNCDIPLVQGQLLQVSLTTHQVVHSFNFVPDGQVGGGIWTTPAVDPTTNTVFVTTGTLSLFSQTLSEAIVALDASTLALKSAWQLPRAEAGPDSDWGTSPTLISDASGRALVVAANKNGVLYAWTRANLAAGPVWRRSIALGGECPQCGDGSISSGAFAGGVLYYAGGGTIINGVGYPGSVRAIDPATGNVLWEHGASQPVFAAIAYDNGLIVDAQGAVVEVLDASTGHSLYTYLTGGLIYSAPSISNGTIYIAATDSRVYAFRVPGASPSPPNDPQCPSGFTCRDIGNPAPGTEQVASGQWTVTAAGAGVQGASDQFRLITQPTSGDLQLAAQLRAQALPGAAQTPQAGLMVRQSADPGAPFYAVLRGPTAGPGGQPGLVVLWRAGFGKNAATAARFAVSSLPISMMIQRRGDVFTAAVSSDGVHYQLLPGTQRRIVMPYQVLAGVATASGVAATTSAATYAAVVIGPPSTSPAPAPSATPCPAGWGCQDVGDPAPVGDQQLAGGVWTLAGVGGAIGGNSDAFHYVWQILPADGTLSAQLTAQGASATAQAGLMFRQTLDAGSPYYAMLATPGKGITVTWRTVSNLHPDGAVTIAGAAPLWLRVQRYTDPTTSVIFFAAYTSSDGVTWNPVLGATVAINLSGPLLAGMAASAGATAGPITATFAAVAFSSASPRPNTLCPDGWTCQDIGAEAQPGSQIIAADGTWQVRASGFDMWDVYDNFRYTWQPLAANGAIGARVVSSTGGGEWQKAGVMLRASDEPESAYYGAFVTPSHGIVVQFRPAEGAATSQVALPGAAPAYLRVARYLDTSRTPAIAYFTAYTSPDGATWTELPNSTVALDMNGLLLAGIAADAYDNGYATTTFAAVALTTTAPPPLTMCPAGWSCADIGGANPGSQQLASGVWSVNGGGGDIWGASDQYRFVWQTLPGDGAASAHITAQSPTDPWAKAGVMLRASADPSAPYYAAFVTPGNGIAVQYRATAGGATSQITSPGGVPAYLLVQRYTNVSLTPATIYFTAYTSPDGATWTPIPNSTVALNLSGPLLAGLAVTAHAWGALSTVTFDSVAISTSAPPSPQYCPTGWNCADIGNPSLAGRQTLSNGTWTVSGSGADIWGTADHFHFIWQSLASDGSISARVLSQTPTDPWAKAGVMLRASADPSAPYYGVFMTPSHGIAVQYRATAGGTTSQVTIPGTLPAYLLVARSGATLTAYPSPDGAHWTPIPNSAITLNLSGPLLAGLVVTAHAWNALSTVMFDSVTIGASLPTASLAPTPSAPPAATPTTMPTAAPTAVPTVVPTVTPSATPSPTPSATPSAAPNATPTSKASSSSATPTARARLDGV